MSGAPLPADDLDAMLAHAWRLLVRATVDRRAALHLPLVSTIGPDGPAARVMVLRAADRERRSLRFHTDSRAGKIDAIAADSRVAVTGYDTGARLQLRLSGRAALLDAAAADLAWACIDAFGRRSYRTTAAPGSPLGAPGSGLPAAFETVRADDPPSEAGRANFAIIEVALDHVEWLLLANGGHRRAEYRCGSGQWKGRWLVP